MKRIRSSKGADSYRNIDTDKEERREYEHCIEGK